MKAVITAIATARPRLHCRQKDILAHLLSLKGLSSREKRLYRRFLSDKSIQSRRFAAKDLGRLTSEDQAEHISRFEKQAPALSARSLRGALRASGIRSNELGCLCAATCTGYLCPGLSSYITELAGLDRELFCLDIGGMGCGAALPAIGAAVNFLSSGRSPYAACVCAEICSSCLILADHPEMILSNSIFSDGSAAAVISAKARAHGLWIMDMASLSVPEQREILRFRNEGGKLWNSIKPEVPGLAGELAGRVVEKLLKRNRLKRSAVEGWALHPGGRKVLESLQENLGLSGPQMAVSREVLRRHGNMSSPSVLYALKELMRTDAEYVMAVSFGAGFSVYACLTRKV